jgi:hypothetical protein
MMVFSLSRFRCSYGYSSEGEIGLFVVQHDSSLLFFSEQHSPNTS